MPDTTHTKRHRPKHKGSAILFKNPLLEKLTKTHIALPLSIFTVISVALIYYGIIEKGFTTPQLILLFFAGMFVFTFIEYIVHRYLYHIKPHEHQDETDTFSYKVHGVHHDYPKDKQRLAMPPIIALILATFFFILYRAIMGDFVFGFLAGFLMGYTIYLCIHYSVHIFTVPNNFLKTLWHHHAVHHYRQPDRAFGVSSPLWDYIFGTMPNLINQENTKSGEFIDDNK
ncbi:sterol desaturase family protein [Flavobacterium beibuense]|uniref:Fatty acid hydroxylase n=1 Tax=Flavobacterium beibuense TaxID=657326 RepID=A0A444WJH5_9FLAO|nr:sterol desaturase family protein [Flavobacterium beibuense]RYJ45822.1 Fatty acid hydroxylase [Flavobacterium beibuense]